MIIGISGYAGSGKDTVGQIIQKLTTPTPMQRSDWEIKKFAGKLKQIASLMTGIPVEKFEDQEFKLSKLGPEWDDMVVREFLRLLGTEAVRNGVHTNAWVNALFADYHDNCFWLITDARFPNEAEVIKSKDGVIVRVNRVEKSDSNHPSEISLDDWNFDYTITNRGTMEELENNVWRVLQGIVGQWKREAVKAQNWDKACFIRDVEKSIIM